MDRIRLILLCFFVGLSFVSIRGQQIANFVTNGGFEQFQTCAGPNIGYLKPNVLGWDEIDDVQGAKWDHYCYGAVPWNLFFYNYPRTDSAYVTYDVFCIPCAPDINRTNIRNTLKAPLQAGKTYCVKFFVNNSEKSSYSIDAFDAYFGGSELDTITSAHIPLSYLLPQIANTYFNYLTDTIGWTAITGTFTAQGGEKYMVIGNLRSDAATHTIMSNTMQASQQWSFSTMAVDDISCIDIELPAYAGGDTVVVSSASIYLGRARDVGIDEACIWYKLPNNSSPIDTAAGIWINPTSTSTYMVVQDVCGNVKRDTVTVYFGTVGLDNFGLSSNKINLAPNPTSGHLNISFSDSVPADMTSFFVTNSLGQVVQQADLKLHGNYAEIETSDLESGLYQIHIRTSFGTVSKKFVRTD
jgi:hypothetical protein